MKIDLSYENIEEMAFDPYTMMLLGAYAFITSMRDELNKFIEELERHIATRIRRRDVFEEYEEGLWGE